ncbi:homocysteine S-methyltransferase family protein [Microbulbifer sp. THAF38]|uniref:homocysteine S-methyltransferase family protein n=1 Tax=Microbulbifer sp. THAF38 TaxID=2587856 RepID=UPI001267C0CD|nr:homocysteine S-methyltransferase family protein [Microbulbifer sp. THAF38]QFT53914.1 homocysteine methyltransferase [Microbulbifer sp. THAF38]
MPEISLDENLINAHLIYSPIGRSSLAKIYNEYIDLAIQASLPLLIAAPTWRANYERVLASEFPECINQDSIAFIRSLIPETNHNVRVGGLIGCKNDCYRPEQSLSISEAKYFHSWQVNEFSNTDVDYLMAVTLPSLSEALGLAILMSRQSKPFIISFVLDDQSNLLDGTPLHIAISEIDELLESKKPLGYFINCVHPKYIKLDKVPCGRLLGVQANASSLSHQELELASSVQVDDIHEWGSAMISLHSNYGVKVLGGCCGTDKRHLEYLIGKI